MAKQQGGALGWMAWRLNRLRRMSLPEIAHRAGQTLHGRMQALGFRLAMRPPEPDLARTGKPWLDTWPTDVDVGALCAAADEVLAGKFDVFALSAAPLGFPPQWNRDPRSGTVAPLVFGKSLNYRDERLVGDIKYLWEPSRHLQLVTLAQAWQVSREARYLDGCRVLLQSWFEQCPYPRGVHWTSSLEHGIRLLNWAVAWQLLGGAQSPLFADERGRSFRRRWLDSIHQHCHFIAGHFSRHSSANNHLLGELMGLFIAALTWPCWPDSAAWLQRARTEFEREALLQNTPDGVNREQAIYYHHEVTDMMLLCGLLGRANGIEFSAAYWQRLERMLEFIAALTDVGGQLPMIGDADDATLVRLDPVHAAGPYAPLLATGAVLFDRSDMAQKVSGFDAQSRWLLGDEAAARFAALRSGPAAARVPRAFPDGGYYVLGQDLDTPQEIRLVADVAPLGYLSIAAHGHADALAFTLSVAGRELLIDPGTYAYHTQKKWRDYFRSTSAHNTACVDGQDQSIIGGNFMWLQHAQAHCTAWESDAQRDHLAGWHDGYMRLPDPVRHSREIVLDKTESVIHVTDEFVCKAAHRITLHWHCHEDATVTPCERGFELRRGDVAVRIEMDTPGLVPRLWRGDEATPLGWVSRCFDAKQPTTTLAWSGELDRSTSIRTRIVVLARSS